MCFSEEASFGAAVGLGVIAGASLQKSGLSRYFYLALIPLFLAVQQFSEGLIWLNLEQVVPASPTFSFFYYYYLFVALVAWPSWVCFSLFMAEAIAAKKVILGGFLLLALIVSAYNLMALLQPMEAIPVEHSIRYDVNIPYHAVWVYAGLTIIPWFFSGLKGSFLAGIVLGMTFIIAGAFYQFAFISVWCFFATLVSVAIYKIICDNLSFE